jgi:hypothetical protein
MAIQNVIGDSFRGAGFNCGGCRLGEVIGGFGMVLDGTKASRRLASMLSGMLTTESQEGVGLVTKPFCYKGNGNATIIKSDSNIVDDSTE